MDPAELLKWQWDGYPRYHQSRTNLLLHIVVVPLFLAGNLALVVGLVGGSFLEQWINFPRFVLSGKWLRALRQSHGQAR